MIYRDTQSIIKRVLEVKVFKIQAVVVFLGIFLSLLSAALLDGKIWLLISSMTIITLGILVLISKRSLVNISDNGPMKEVDGGVAIHWGIFYIILGIIVSVFYLF